MPGRRAVRFCRSSKDTLWAAGDLGLLRWGRDGRATLFDERQGIAERSLVGVLPDSHGRLWLAGRDGHLQGVRIADLDAAALATHRDAVERSAKALYSGTDRTTFRA